MPHPLIDFLEEPGWYGFSPLRTHRNPVREVVIRTLPTLGIVPDPEMDPDSWALHNEPWYYLRVGMYVWEEIKGLKRGFSVYDLCQLLTKRYRK